MRTSGEPTNPIPELTGQRTSAAQPLRAKSQVLGPPDQLFAKPSKLRIDEGLAKSCLAGSGCIRTGGHIPKKIKKCARDLTSNIDERSSWTDPIPVLLGGVHG